MTNAPATSSSKRSLDRRSVYIGEGLSVFVVSDAGEVAGEVVDLTPHGLGIAVLEGEALPEVGSVVTIDHTGPATNGILQTAIVRNVSQRRLGGELRCRVGVEIVADAGDESTRAPRGSERYACPVKFPAMASAMCPIFFREWLHFNVTDFAAGGMTLTTSIRNKAQLAGLELDFTLTLPLSGAHQVRGRITSVRRDGESLDFTVGVAWLEASAELHAAIAEYLLLGNKTLTPAGLRKGGLKVGSIERAVTYGYATTPEEHAEILALRLRAHQAEGRMLDSREEDMASPFDAHSRHIVCRFGGRIIGYVRVIYVNGDAARSQYVSRGGHQVPDWLWKEGFLEAGAGAMDPEFRKTSIFPPLMQHAARIVSECGKRFLLGACDDSLLGMYEQMGFTLLETRTVEPKPAWRFRSHLICLTVPSARGQRAAPRNTAPTSFRRTHEEGLLSLGKVVRKAALPSPTEVSRARHTEFMAIAA
jgi:hypothetical protein